jgi:hypothetical protein
MNFQKYENLGRVLRRQMWTAVFGRSKNKDDSLAKLNGTETDTATPGHTTRGTRASDWLHFALFSLTAVHICQGGWPAAF